MKYRTNKIKYITKLNKEETFCFKRNNAQSDLKADQLIRISINVTNMSKINKITVNNGNFY